jgi:hypothetical protein
MMSKLVLALVASAVGLSSALVAKPATPIMGFSTWNCFAGAFDEKVLWAAAESMSSSGLVKSG